MNLISEKAETLKAVIESEKLKILLQEKVNN